MSSCYTGTVYHPGGRQSFSMTPVVCQNLSATGNIESDTITYDLVPYSGAIHDVDLGSYNIYAANISESGDPVWGSIAGSLSNQTDLQNSLDNKATLVHTHAASGITSGEFDNARISQSSVIQYEGDLTISTGQISDLDLSVYVPYSGATGDVNLGNWDLTTDGALSSASLTLSDNYSIEWNGSDAVHTVSSGIVKYNTHIHIGSHKIGKFSSVANSYIYFTAAVDNPIFIGNAGFRCWTSGSQVYDAYISGGLILTDYSEDIVAIEGDVKITSDSKKLYFGAGDDSSIYYDGTNFNIDTDEVAPSDLIIDCGTDKTLELEECVWNDIQFNIQTGRTSAANFPDWDATFTTNTGCYKFDVDDYIDLGANEMLHDWKEGTSIYPHIHTALDGGNASGTTQYAKFTIYMAYADADSVWVETTKYIEIEIPDGTSNLTHLFGSASAISMTGLTIGTQINVRLKRIAATSGTEYPNHIFITQVGLHYEVNTMGSRQIGTK